jgi:hypothetical protein
MAKLGYTWYPKDWGNSESVFELTLIERGLYRELIDMAMLNDNKTTYNSKLWARKFGSSESEIESILITLVDLKLIELNNEFLFIPSCESRLNLVRGGSKGGKKSKPIVKPIVKPNIKPFESLSEKNLKPTSNQREKESKIEIESKTKENIIDNSLFVFQCKESTQWIEVTAMQNKVSPKIVNLYLENFENHLIQMEEQKETLKEYKEHFTHWLKKQDLSNFRVQSYGKTNQV